MASSPRETTAALAEMMRLDRGGTTGKIPHMMTVVASEGSRIRLPGIKPKHRYRVREHGRGWLVEPMPEPKLAGKPEKVILGKLIRKDGVMVLDFGGKVTGEAIVAAVRDHRKEMA